MHKAIAAAHGIKLRRLSLNFKISPHDSIDTKASLKLGPAISKLRDLTLTVKSK
jgi:hypothetical protein